MGAVVLADATGGINEDFVVVRRIVSTVGKESVVVVVVNGDDGV